MPASLKVRVLLLAVAISATHCAPAVTPPMPQPVQVMVEAWGPFARQCSTTRVSHYEAHRQLSPSEVVQTHTTCVGFSAFRRADGSVEITASMNADTPSTNPIVSRILRRPGGTSRTAVQGEAGLLAYGSDLPEAAAVLARDIGLTERQLVGPNALLRLPIRLHVPAPLDGVLACRPLGQSVDHSRRVLVLTCTLDQAVNTPHLQATLHLTGEQQVDIATGVRLSSEMTGWLNGRARQDERTPWQPVAENVAYTKATEFE